MKTYNCEPQKKTNRLYQFINTNLVGSINSIDFSSTKYFFIFTNNATRMIEMYTKIKISDWLKCLKTYYSICYIKLKEAYPIERLKSDYESEL